ncbi:hypothetical protein GEMRC1_004800 [Eukaryota sp. GEM-RC1]
MVNVVDEVVQNEEESGNTVSSNDQVSSKEVLVSKEEPSPVKKPPGLPLFLQLFPFLLIVVIVVSITLKKTIDFSLKDLGLFGDVIHLLSAFCVPFGLYYAGAGVKAEDLKFSKLSKTIVKPKIAEDDELSLQATRYTLFLNFLISPIIVFIIFGSLLLFGLIPSSWFCVMFINAILPVTATNIFLLDFGLDKMSTVFSISTSTIISVPMVLVLIPLFDYLFN